MLQRNEDKEERRTMSLGYPRYARNNKTEYRLTEKLVALIPIERLVFHFSSSFHVGRTPADFLPLVVPQALLMVHC